MGRPLALHLRSADVIHSFWIPRFGGKKDVNPVPRTPEGVDPLHRNAVLGAGAFDTADDLPVRRPDHQHAVHAEEPEAGARLELAPEAMGAFEQRHVGGILEVGAADHARLPVRAAPVVRDARLPLEHEHARPSTCEPPRRRAPHGARAHDRDVPGHSELSSSRHGTPHNPGEARSALTCAYMRRS